MKRSTVFLIHGFFGLPGDWQKWLEQERVRDIFKNVDVRIESLWSHIMDFDSWAEKFCNEAEKVEGPKCLIGYSLGGRLALHALARRPEIFSSAILVSANPGLSDQDQRAQRLMSDRVWADKFRKLPWADLVAEWNAQPVFSKTFPSQIELERFESDFDRELLAESLELWSLGYQFDFRALLPQLNLPLLFVTGEQDTKFTELTREMVGASPAEPLREHVIVAQAGHRVPWDNPAEFGRVVANFLGRWYR